MIGTDQIKHFAWSLAGATGIIILWRGIWEGSSYIPFLENLWVSLIIGASMLAISAFKFQDFPLDASERIIKSLQTHPQKHEFHLRYKDHILGKDISIHALEMKDIYNNLLLLQGKDGSLDYFVPTERIDEITFQGKTHWRKEKKKESGDSP